MTIRQSNRSVRVPDTKSDSGAKITEAALLEMAAQNKTGEVLTICRKIHKAEELWGETLDPTAEGSFRYWSAGKMVFGINVSGKLADAPEGELDIWLRTEKLAEVSGQPEPGIKERFSKISRPFRAGRMNFVMRLKGIEDAQRLLTELKEIAASQPRHGTD